MSNDIWFKRKTYGWGWTPANLKGWLVTVIFIVAVSIYPVLLSYSATEFNPVIFMGINVFSVIALIATCLKKGEKPGWQWGNKK